MNTQAVLRQLKEAGIDAQSFGGLSRSDLETWGLLDIAPLAAQAVPRFKETVMHGGSIKEWFRVAKEACRRMKEAQSETALGFLLRKGVQTVAMEWYQTTPPKWREYAGVESSSGVAEWYPTLYIGDLPTEVPRGTEFPEGKTVGEETVVRNKKWGKIEAFERELFDDDQTGGIKNRAARIGQQFNTFESVYAARRFVGAAATYANLVIPVSEYTTVDVNNNAVTGPFSASLYGTSGNRPTTFGAMNMGKLKTAYQACITAVDPQSNIIAAMPDTLVYSPFDTINAKTYLAPGLYPATVGQSDTTAANAPVLGGTTSAAGANQGVTAGFAGGVMSKNQLADLGLALVMDPYFPAWAWAMGQKGRGFICQERDPFEIIEEAKNAGSYFTFDAIRYRGRIRAEWAWIAGGSRFWYLGNDGSATGVQ